MSVSQIMPEDIVPAGPETTPSDVAPAEPETRRRTPLNLKKIARTGGLALLIASLLGSVVTIVVMAGKISTLSIRVNSLDAAFRSGQMSQLSGSVSTLEEKSLKYGKQLESLSSGLLSAKNQMAGYQDDLSKFSRTLNDFSSEEQAQRTAIDGHSERIDAISTRLSQMEERVAGLAKTESNNAQNSQKQAQQPVTRGKTPARPGTGNTAKKPERSVRRAAVEAPFVLTGIERRGGQMFVVVIPRGNSQISSMRLLSPGDGMLGWTLRAIRDNGTAVFSVNGAEQSLQVQ
ncbi:plasmid transfer protein [Citrobacter koseri]|uniref:plasmid transfer protein n=1 Tax=Citrobacter koseri TaxID=545 RepID=UPI002B39A1F9|nr:plasmid transfer protein [Citrobacter koseri]MEB2704073.1 plasmid transfer protein [Citrobacter koseri]MEB2708998.1 plasmid transfer protein [Citrobacter koseri]